MPRPVHFEIPADDPERAGKFYEDVFGWQISKWDGPEDYWLIKSGDKEQPGIDGGIARKNDMLSSVTNTIDVPDVDQFTDKIKSKGGTVLMPKMAVPEVGWMAYCKDTEGNIFGLMQMDPTAK
ncbi:MAG: VOC family protein [candidate division Zixibacteria bacterium]|jgi:hypothetical protein|nr:VOC family protein [candidate division Zixibacteria bacterium]